MATRKGRVQVRSGIGERNYDTYRAVDMPHVGPQRRESQASNYERLARDLGAFNSALQGAGRAIDAANKRAAARAEKLEKEKKAAEERAKRKAAYKKRGGGGGRRSYGGGGRTSRSEKRRLEYDEKVSLEDEWGQGKDTGAGRSKVDGSVVHDPGVGSEVLGDPSATKKTYKSLSAVKAGIGKDFYEEGLAKLEQEKREGFKRYKEDEHGNREYIDPNAKMPDLGIVKAPTAEEERDPTKQSDTMLTKSGYKETTEVITDEEIRMQGYKQQALITEKFGHDPVVMTHLKGVTHKLTEKRLEWQKKAEYEDRRNTAGQFVRDTIADNIKTIQADPAGFNPDQVSKMAQSQAMADMQLLFPDATRDEITHYMFAGLDDSLGPNATADDARMVLNFIQGSPATENGVASWIKHPKYQKIAQKLASKASQIFVNQKAETRKQLLATNYIKAMDAKQPRPFIGDINETPVNGKTKRIAASETRALVGKMLDDAIMSPGGIPVDPKDIPKKLPDLLRTYEDAPDITSPYLNRIFSGFKITETHGENPAQMSAWSTAMTAYAMGGDSVAALQRHLNPSQKAYFDQLWALRRNGIVDEKEQVEKMTLWVQKKRRGESGPSLGTKLENAARPWHPKDLSRTQRDQILDSVRMSVYDKAIEPEELTVRLEEAAENYREYNPTINGQTVEINPALGLKGEEFVSHINTEIEGIKQRHPHLAGKELSVRRYGNLYLYVDAESGKYVYDKDGDNIGVSMQGLLQAASLRARLKQGEGKVADKKNSRENYKYEKSGGDWGALGRFFSGKSLDTGYLERDLDRMEKETGEIRNMDLGFEERVRNPQARSYSGPDLSNWKDPNG